MGTGNFCKNEASLKLLEEWSRLEMSRRMDAAWNFLKNGGCLKLLDKMVTVNLYKNEGNLELLEELKQLETSRRMEAAWNRELRMYTLD